jgi:ATP-dependent DNA helicase DinG
MVIEAPTGVGKTFAYLIPSLLYSVKFWEPVLVSTNTKALQDQIFYKDLAYLKEHSGIDFSYAKLKGRKNYFSISQFFEAYFISCCHSGYHLLSKRYNCSLDLNLEL